MSFFVPDSVKGVTEMKKVMRPGGSTSAYVWDIYWGVLPTEPFHKEFGTMNIEYPCPPSAKASKIDLHGAVWINAGLPRIRTKKISVQRTFQSLTTFGFLVLSRPL